MLISKYVYLLHFIYKSIKYHWNVYVKSASTFFFVGKLYTIYPQLVGKGDIWCFLPSSDPKIPQLVQQLVEKVFVKLSLGGNSGSTCLVTFNWWIP